MYRLLLILLLMPAVARSATLPEVVPHPELWPVEFQVTSATRATVVRDGRSAGAVGLPAGRMLSLTGLTEKEATGRLGGMTVTVPVALTDLAERVAGIAAPALPQPTPAPRAPQSLTAASPSAPAAVAPTEVQRWLVGHLTELRDGRLQPYDLRRLNGVKLYGILFSAGWCGPCRDFAPHLLDSYRRLKEMYPEFELVLVSRDRSPADMLAYMREERMPWPALKHGSSREIEGIESLAGPGIPCLVLIDARGRVLAHSFKGDDYLGPDSVLDATWRELQRRRRADSGG